MSQKYNRSIVILRRTTLDFRKVIYENVEKKKHSFRNKHIYIYGSHTSWSFILYILQRFVLSLETVAMLSICINHFHHWELRKNNSKLKFTKNRRASWSSRGRLKISKFSISLVWLGECSKIKIIPLNRWCKQQIDLYS